MAIETATSEIDIIVSHTGNFNIITLDHLSPSVLLLVCLLPNVTPKCPFRCSSFTEDEHTLGSEPHCGGPSLCAESVRAVFWNCVSRGD